LQISILNDVIAAAGYGVAGTDFEVQIGSLFHIDEDAVDERLYDGEWALIWNVWLDGSPSADLIARMQCIVDRVVHSHTLAGVLTGLEMNEVTYPT
jgi:hypothetical protein